MCSFSSSKTINLMTERESTNPVETTHSSIGNDLAGDFRNHFPCRLSEGFRIGIRSCLKRESQLLL